MYSYRLVTLLGVEIFLSFTFLARLISLIFFSPVSDTTTEELFSSFFRFLLESFRLFALICIPVVIVLSIFLFTSNIRLIRSHGFSPKNLLGIFLSTALIGGIIFNLFFVYELQDSLYNVHSYLGYHLSSFVETVSTLIFVYLECMMFATFYASLMAARHVPSPNKDYCLILGCYVNPDGTPGGILKARIDRAIELSDREAHETGRNLIFIPSGGKGTDEPVSEAAAMAKYLAGKSIPPENILLEDRSKTTFENMKYSKSLISKTTGHKKVDGHSLAFATTDFHLFRSGVIATSLGLEGIEGIGSRSSWYFYPNALIREFAANLLSEYKTHLFNLINITLAIAIAFTISYFFNIL